MGASRGVSGTGIWTIGLALVTDSVPEGRIGYVLVSSHSRAHVPIKYAHLVFFPVGICDGETPLSLRRAEECTQPTFVRLLDRLLCWSLDWTG